MELESNSELINENIALKSQLAAVNAEHDLVATTIKIFGFKIKELFTAKEFAHYSRAALSWFAKKTSEVVAPSLTWSRVIRHLLHLKN
ncbi:MAG: hypothetical protein ACOH5I_03425 [Oligoflexus sp.]